MARYSFCFILIFLAFSGVAQVNRYMIFFKDKSGTAFSIDQPEKFLSAKSITRRVKQNVVTNADDLPVSAQYIQQVRAAGAKTYYTTRWMNGVLSEMQKDTVKRIMALPFVSSVVLVAPGNKFSAGRLKKIKSKTSAAQDNVTTIQLVQLGMGTMHDQGFHGENISIGVIDAGFPGVDVATQFQPLRDEGRIKLTYNFVTNTPSVYQPCAECSHGTQVLSTIAVNTGGFVGGAYAADFYLFVTEDNNSEYRVEEYNWLFAAEKADSVGVDLINTSLGYSEFDDYTMDYKVTDMNGSTTAIARAASIALTKGIVLVCSAGNEGATSWHAVTSPGDVAGILAVGATDLNNNLTLFSSHGPSADGRIKPDVIALGSSVAVVLPGGMIATNGGTSFSSPLVTGLTAGVMQAFPFLTAPQVYDAIIKSADRAASPDNYFGYGIPHFETVKKYVESKNVVNVYPNPSTTSKVNIKFTYNVGLTNISFYDSFGKLLSQRAITIDGTNNPVEYDISSLASGVYLIKVSNSFASQTFRFVKS